MAVSVRAYRTRQASLGLPDSSRRNRSEHDRRYRKAQPVRAFVGCDGEGAGVDDAGRQLYQLFRMGDRELYRGGARLETAELLDFICDAPANAIYVGFAFGYDVTMILRDLPERQKRRLFEPRQQGQGHSPFIWFGDFDIDYLPRNYLKVRRVRRMVTPDGKERRVTVAGSTRVIYETFGFFQKSFLKIINEFDVGTPSERESIAANKARRSDFVTIDQEERDYCALECRMLAELMEKLRTYCDAADIKPQSWSGAGKLAKALHRKHETLTKADAETLIPPGVRDFASIAYYGGRFEITATGHVNQPVYEYDINSAYPAAMVGLPCLTCCTWKELGPADFKCLPAGSLYVATCKFKADDLKPNQWGRLGAFPVRSKEGHLFWPLEGGGTYWSHEIESAAALGFQVKRLSGWLYVPGCNHRPFEWVGELYEYRRSIGSQGPGYPIKLGTNSLYGQLAQRVGNPRYRNMIWAGLITSYTRSLLNKAIALAPRSIIMLATDGVYSTEPLDLPIGPKLGQWDKNELEDLFIVQPGLYWSQSKRKKKSRGLSGKFFEDVVGTRPDGSPIFRTDEFAETWNVWRGTDLHRERSGLEAPSLVGGMDSGFPYCPVLVPGFVGLKLALARNKPDLAGTWVRDFRNISFDYRNKRARHTWGNPGEPADFIVTSPKLGGRSVVSLAHRDFLAAGGAETWEASRLMLEEQPDYIDLSAPFED